jgi:hypothetical protein
MRRSAGIRSKNRKTELSGKATVEQTRTRLDHRLQCLTDRDRALIEVLVDVRVDSENL